MQEHINSMDCEQYEARIKSNDRLLITVSSPTLSQEVVAQFNLPMTSFLSPGDVSVQTSSSIQTYLVDRDGYINFPVIGNIKLGELSIAEAKQSMAEKISTHINKPIINLEIISFKVTVMGEVFKPASIDVANGRISILDALGEVGDLTIYGNRKNVKIIRDNNGKKEFASLDLTSSSIFSSPYFYLQQNDVVIVEPNNTRKKESRYGESERYKLSVFSTALSSVSVIASTMIAIISINKTTTITTTTNKD
ncbi:polysaccharide export outer membrane protein [Bacteroidales bacterium]|nr:polysaccharide export outer membrane protein [Bacteroidales bacterium]